MSASGERCEVCGAALTGHRTGRPARYCSATCRQRAYRRRAEPVAPIAVPSLPAALDAFVGRERDLAELESLLGRYRLVTLLGPGGAGKTRLSVELATRLRTPAHFVELAPVTTPALVARTVADALGIVEEIGRPVLDTVAEALSRDPCLLVLDNCEHLVVSAAQVVTALLRRCPSLRVVATTRESLEIPGEVVVRIGELPVEDAVQLFVERATASSPDFELTNDNFADVAAICAELDGMPLAIELAARRIRLFGVAEIRSRLADRFGLLTSGPRTAARRHRDLRTTIEWSYDLLEPDEQAVLRRLSVLVGGFSMATAAAVSDVDDVLDVLSGLESRSLVVPGPRFRQLESIRLYGLDKLRAAVEEDETYDRLAAYLLGLARPLVGDGMLHCYEELAPLDAERDNLAAVVEWAALRGDDRHLALATALGRCWRQHGYVSDGSAMMLAALDAAGPDHPDRSTALVTAANLVISAGDHAHAASLAAEAVELESGGHPVRLVKALSALGNAQLAVGARDQAFITARRALALAPSLTNPLDRAVCLHNQAYQLLQCGHADEAAALMEQCLPLYREHSPHPVPPEWLHSAGALALARDEVSLADKHFREALERYPRDGRADALPVTAIESLEGLAAVAARQRRFVRAVRLDAVAESARHDRKLGREATGDRQRAATLALARSGLSPAAFRQAELDGAEIARHGAVEFAITDAMVAGPTELSEREIAVARLVALGHSNRQIAARLRMSERSLETCLRDMRKRLRLRTRAQLAAWTAAHLP
ncbi:hypothetical protein Lesp02_71810 [Lentzea sp. NBRC 105346]|uniref:ATP-binding protein n=1 Tax=Lentzea sp. NBRC 105346 TaxID=3032205 RepID=UPI0024A49ACA|nr:LuxR C-terminal-related transcriptional regulator [Lentzea sp. NBRC 105346]GLZ34994.1 hypothetical protein Lesp02_71810 [Lentzea sp. NBRC 105346]